MTVDGISTDRRQLQYVWLVPLAQAIKSGLLKELSALKSTGIFGGMALSVAL